MQDIYSVFGNKIRSQLIGCLAQNPKNVTQMISVCGLSQSAVSQHLKKLKASGLVVSEKIGKEVVYTLKYKKAARISSMLTELERSVV